MLGGLASLLLVQVLVLPALLLATERRRREPAPEAPDAPGSPGTRHAAAAPG
jgi:hypothetical protein